MSHVTLAAAGALFLKVVDGFGVDELGFGLADPEGGVRRIGGEDTEVEGVDVAGAFGCRFVGEDDAELGRASRWR